MNFSRFLGVNCFIASLLVAPFLHAASSNDTCAGATVIAPATLPYKALVDLAQNTNTISFGQGEGTGQDAYWKFTPAQSGNYEIIAYGRDVVLGVFTGACGSLSLFQSVNLDLLSARGERMTLFLQAGTAYTFVVQAFDPLSGGPTTITFRRLTAANDTCATAINLTPRSLPFEQRVPISAHSDTIGSGTGLSGRDSYWRFTPAATGPFQIFASEANMVVSVLTGNCGALTELYTQNFDNTAFGGEVASVQLQQGIPYTIVAQTAHLFSLNDAMTFRFAQAPPSANNTCQTSSVISQLPFKQTIDLTGNSDTIKPTAGAVGGRDAYWRYTPAQTGVHRIEAFGEFDTVVAVYTGACGSLTQVSNQNAGNLPPFGGESHAASLTADTTYTIVVSGLNEREFGSTTLEVSLADSETNDTCATARTINPAWLPFCAKQEMFVHTHTITPVGVGEGNGKDVFYRFTPATTGRYRLEAANQDVVMALYTGACGSLNQINAQDLDNRLEGGETAVVQLNAGTTYTIVVQTYSNVTTSAPMIFSMEFIKRSANNRCADATVIEAQSLPYSDTIDTDANAANHVFGPVPTNSPDAFWRLFVSQTGPYRIEATGFDTVLGVFTGPCGSLQPVHVQDNDNLGVLGEQAIVNLTAGTTYTFAVRGAFPQVAGRVKFEIKPDMPFDTAAQEWLAYE